jgi:hypothetical protein
MSSSRIEDPRDPARIRVTLGELVESVAAITSDLAEQAAVVEHILRTCAATRLDRRAECLP